MTSPNSKGLALLLALVLFAAAIPRAAEADTAEQTFYRAQVEYRNFKKDEDRLRFRDGWLAAVRKFQEAFQKAPQGRFAPASLFMTGKLYGELHARSGLKEDRQEAVDAFSRLVRRFPDSDYRPRAEEGLRKISAPIPRPGGADSVAVPTLTVKVPKDRPTPAPSAQKAVIAPKVEKPEDSIRPAAVAAGPAGRKTPDPECQESKAAYKARVANGDVSGPERRRPASAPRTASRAASRPTPSDDPVGDLIRRASAGEDPASRRGGPAIIEGIRFWSNPNYTRIVVDADRETGYTHELLEPDAAAHRPQRLYIDFANSQLGRNLPDVLPIDDDLLSGARAGQRNRDTVRVVIDIKSFKTYKIFSLDNPFRTIIDVWGSEANGRIVARNDVPRTAPRPVLPATPRPDAPTALARDPGPAASPNDLARQLALGVRRIVLDPGHGGHDPGAPGAIKGIWEKDLVLKIALKLEKMIQRHLGAEVILTRRTDRYLTLEERTAIANTRNADLFVSIHLNAHTRRAAYGIETYYLNLTTDEDAIRVAARENAASRKSISDLQVILNDLMQNAKINESSRLAGHVQTAMYHTLKNRYDQILNKGVKQAPFYVLLGAQMPAILVEASFVSNPRECRRLLTDAYQNHIAAAILSGIESYVRETTPTAFGENTDASMVSVR
ncbi:MAG: N-acetylmuramoyl-L-alanine amidase [Desulfococcaceae bacterium]